MHRQQVSRNVLGHPGNFDIIPYWGFDDHYFVDGILNKNFAYGTYPTEKERQQIVSQFKEDILSKLQ